MMKKTLLSVLLVPFTLLLLIACSSDDEDNAPANESGNSDENLSASIAFEQISSEGTIEREP